MLFRAIVAFVALPGMVAFVVPLWLIAPRSAPFGIARALVPLLLGVVLLLWCVREFYVAGRGTLAPWSPPKHLVTSGLYRFSRNPMYIAVLLVLVGWALGFGTRPLWIYAASMAIAFHLRVLLYEEPKLRELFPSDWAEYSRRVSRWIGRPTRAG